MKKIIFFWVCLSTITSIAQKQTYDLVSFTPSAGWNYEVKDDLTSYTFTNCKDDTWCRTYNVKSYGSHFPSPPCD